MTSNNRVRHGRFKATAAPLLQAQIDINAPVPRVWSLITDFSRMPQWSPQCRMMKMFGPLRPGARTVNINRRNFQFWPTTMHGHRSDPGAEGGVPGRYQRPDLELRAAADRAGHPCDRESPRRERRQTGSQLRGERVLRRRAQFRA